MDKHVSSNHLSPLHGGMGGKTKWMVRGGKPKKMDEGKNNKDGYKKR